MSATAPHPSASFSESLRVHLDNEPGSFARLARAIGAAGGLLGAIDLVRFERGKKVRDVTVLPGGALRFVKAQWQESGGENQEAEMAETKRTTTEEARRVGDEIGVDWRRFDLEQFRSGMDVEFEHGSHDPQTDVTRDDPIVTGKIALAHMKEFPDYYERLKRMEAEAERDWAAKKP